MTRDAIHVKFTQDELRIILDNTRTGPYGGLEAREIIARKCIEALNLCAKSEHKPSTPKHGYHISHASMYGLSAETMIRNLTRAMGPPPRDRWEYLTTDRRPEKTDFESLGQEGWELVALHYEHAYFKRRKL